MESSAILVRMPRGLPWGGFTEEATIRSFRNSVVMCHFEGTK